MSFGLIVLAMLVGIVIGSGLSLLFMYNEAVGMHNLYKDLYDTHQQFKKETAAYIEQLDIEIEDLKYPKDEKLGIPIYDDHDFSGLLEDD